MVKNLPAMQETQVQCLGWEDALEEEMATYSSILAWGILWTEEPGGLQSMGSQRVGHDWMTEHTGMPDYKLLEAECVSFFSITGNTGDRKGFMLDTG